MSVMILSARGLETTLSISVFEQDVMVFCTFVGKFIPILTSINYYRGGTGVLANEKEAPVIFTNAIHENSAYLEMATREMTSIVEWENGFHESQQAESVPQRFP